MDIQHKQNNVVHPIQLIITPSGKPSWEELAYMLVWLVGFRFDPIVNVTGALVCLRFVPVCESNAD